MDTITTPAGALDRLGSTAFITDGGLETTLVFHQGIDLPDFAAFPLLDDDAGRDTLTSYFGPYLDIAERDGVGMVLDTPTWRANPDWATRLGYSRDDLDRVNRDAVTFARFLGDARTDTPIIVNGVVGPRGDGYVVGDAMTPDAAKTYHLLQAQAFAEAGADLMTAVTMTYVDEAIGVVEAARAAGIPVAIGFTVETDGRLPSGQSLRSAIEAVDAATGAAAEYFMVNCAHPSHFVDVLDDEPWLGRIKVIRANASRMSHDELDEAEELDRGDVDELAGDYLTLRDVLPELWVVGGCCGTDHEHVSAISTAFAIGR